MADDEKPLGPSPVEVHDPIVRNALKQAGIWLGIAAALFIAWKLAQPLLLIVGALVFAALFDAGTRLLGRVWNGPRGLRLTIVVLFLLVLVVAFIAISGWQLMAQADQLRVTLTIQIAQLIGWLQGIGLGNVFGNIGRDPLAGVLTQMFGSVGRMTEIIGGALGAIGSLILMVILGLFIAAEPRLYERGVAWLTPARSRGHIYEVMEAVAEVLRRWTAGRLFAMVVDGGLTGIGLMIAGVPLAGILGLIAGVLAFIPNVGAAVAGVLIVLVGFSAGTEIGLWALGVYALVQFVEGYLITPFVERKAVDLAPAVTLAAQLLFGALFGILGVAMADPIMAIIKTSLEKSRAKWPSTQKPQPRPGLS